MNTSLRYFALGLILLVLPLSAAVSAGPGSLTGTVRDPSGAVVLNARVRLLDASQAVLAVTRSDEQGRFTLSDVPAGHYLLVVDFSGFEERRVAVSAPGDTDVTLDVRPMTDEVTVTANVGEVMDTRNTAQPVSVITREDIAERATTVLAQAVSETTGVQVMRTGPAIAGVFVRGLSGNKVGVYIDGVRYSAARGAVNTFLDLVDPIGLDRIEVLRGPGSAQYGSDAIGGTLQLLSTVPSFISGRRTAGAQISILGNSADQGGAASVTADYATGSVALLGNITARTVGDLRPGQGLDSRAAVTRFFDLPSDKLMPRHLPDTGFSQTGGFVKANWLLAPGTQLIGQYRRSQQKGAHRYDQMLGGDGNLVADSPGVGLDLGYVRLQTSSLGWLQHFTATYSYNTQHEQRLNQGGNGNPKSTITSDNERTRIHGLQVSGGRQLGSMHDLLVGGDVWAERVSASETGLNPVTNVSSIRRPRIPDGATNTSGGVYVQDTMRIGSRANVMGNVRYSGASYTAHASDSPIVNGSPLWPDDHSTVSALTFRLGGTIRASEGLTLSANVGRGFRAPHMTDLGTLGLTNSGYQVSAAAIGGMAAAVGTNSGSTATSTGEPVTPVGPETNVSWEAGARYARGGLSATVTVFRNDVHDLITSQSLILPSGAVGTRLGDQIITSQGPTGVVYVSAATNPVLVRTNVDSVRMVGIEHDLTWRVQQHWTVETVFTYLRGSDPATGAPPNLEQGVPPPEAYLKLRYTSTGGRYYVEPVVHLAARQTRLSSGDLEDRRLGAMRSRTTIKAFFNNGATARGWVSAGKDGKLGTADDILIATGETLAQIQDRVLGKNVDSAPLFTTLPGYTTLALRGGVKFGPHHDVLVSFDNLTDKNYRGMGWGIDAAGRSLRVRYEFTF